MNDEYLYRYFNSLNNPFENLLELDLPYPIDYVTYIKNKNLDCSEIYDETYFYNRINIEKEMAKIFRSMGGHITRKTPYYFTLGNADYWFKKRKSFRFSIAIPLSAFAREDITFTYGDSYPAYMHSKSKDAFNLYTLDYLHELLKFDYQKNKVNLPNYINYIEAQVWNDNVIKMYKPNFNFYTHSWFEHIKYISFSALHINQNLRKVTCINNLIKSLLKDKTNFIIDMINNYLLLIPPQYIPLGEMHGRNHLIRVAILSSVLLGLCNKLTDENINIIIAASIFHDIGRSINCLDKNHAEQSATLYMSLFSDRQEAKFVSDLIMLHDKPRQFIYENYHDLAFLSLLEILQDADTLDYLRFGAHMFIPEKLRLNESIELIHFAMELIIASFGYGLNILDFFKEVCKNELCL